MRVGITAIDNIANPRPNFGQDLLIDDDDMPNIDRFLHEHSNFRLVNGALEPDLNIQGRQRDSGYLAEMLGEEAPADIDYSRCKFLQD